MELATEAEIDEAILDVRAAQSIAPVDLLITGVSLVNVYSEEIHSADIAIRRHRIVAIRDGFMGEARARISGTGLFAWPGSIEPDIVVTDAATERALLERGVTSIIGEALAAQHLAVWSRGEGARPFQPEQVVGSAAAALAALRQGVLAIIDAGLCADWDGFFAEIAAQDIDSGRFVLRQSARTEDPVAAAIAAGQNPARARQLVSFNAAVHFAIDHEVGGIAPGRRADIVLGQGLSSTPRHVIAGGRVVF